MTSLRPSLLLACAATAACQSSADFAAEADRAAYGLVDQSRASLFQEDAGFRIEPDPDSLRQRILRGEMEQAVAIDLVGCLRIASENNREYQTRKESLYRTALALTLEQWRLGWQPFAGGDAAADGVGGSGTTQSGSFAVGLSRVLGTGAEIIGGIGLSLFKSVGSGEGFTTTSDLSLAVTQPLLRGSGSRIVYEPLTQAQRDLVYEVRSFERFRRSFAVDVTTRVLRLLQQADAIRNEEANVENLRILRERNEALAEAGRQTNIEVDQARQDEVASENRLLVARVQLQTAYDDFLLFLGLPIDTPISLELSELDRLKEGGLVGIAYGEEDVLEFALENRLDYMTSLDRVSDAERKVYVAANALEAGLDVAGSVDLESKDGKPLDFDPNDARWNLLLTLDLPVNRIPERNFYRSELIDLQAAQRDAGEFADTIIADLRAELRDAVAAGETYEIQLFSADLAERRVESTQLSLQAGRATTRDILESQRALLDSRNLVTSAFVSFWLARLALYRDMEALEIADEGIVVRTDRIDAMLDEAAEDAAEVDA